MSHQGFQELVKLAKRGNQRHLDDQTEREIWSGVSFELNGQKFIAPLGEVSEVIQIPAYTVVPQVKSWLLGIANIRGRLLNIVDLNYFIHGKKNINTSNGKLLCISVDGQYVGLLVDQVLGVQHFNKTTYFSENQNLAAEYQRYCQGYFILEKHVWHIFLLGKLLENAEFNHVSEPYIH